MGCCIKNNRYYYPVHIRQGDLDGACSVYSLMMNLLILKKIKYKELTDVLQHIKVSRDTKQLFDEFFKKHGLIRGGFKFSNLKKLINLSFGEKVTVKSYDEEHQGFEGLIDIISNALQNNLPIIIGIDYPGGGGHAILAIGYEYDEEGIFNIFCLDPGIDANPSSYWNTVICLDFYKNRHYRDLSLTSNPQYHPNVRLTEVLLVTPKN